MEKTRATPPSRVRRPGEEYAREEFHGVYGPVIVGYANTNPLVVDGIVGS